MHVIFTDIGINQIKRPFISKQLADCVVELSISRQKITGFDDKVFDIMPKLERLELLENNLDKNLLSSGFVFEINHLKKTLFVDG